MYASIPDIVASAATGNVESVTVHRTGPIDRTIVVYVTTSDVFVELTSTDGQLSFCGVELMSLDNAAVMHAADVVLGHVEADGRSVESLTVTDAHINDLACIAAATAIAATETDADVYGGTPDFHDVVATAVRDWSARTGRVIDPTA